MKKALTFVFLLFTVVHYSNSQTTAEWIVPKKEIVFANELGEVAKMKMDPGLRYADIDFREKSYRVFYHRNNNIFKRARIVDNDTQIEVARGKGSFFWSTGRFKFESGDEIRVLYKRKPNGYEIIGPFGTLFKVENHGVSPVKVFNDMDFLAQAFFLFDHIKVTQKPPSDTIMLITSTF